MATREENLKKLNEELEQLSDEQLEQVAGGRLIHWGSINQPNQENPIQKPETVAFRKSGNPFTD